MDRIKTVLRDIMPCWYELSWLEKLPAIILRVHNDFIGYIKEQKIDFENAPIIMRLKIEFGFKNFIGDFGGNFGFDDALKRRGEKDGFTEFLIKIPKVKKITNKPCGRCNGKGKDRLRNDKCLMCEGRGKEYKYDWKIPYAISASLKVFFMLALFPKMETSVSFPQLMTLTTVTARGNHGGAIHGEFSIPLAKWLNSNFCDKKEAAEKMKQAAMRAYKRMFGMSKFDRYNFDAKISDVGGVMLSCPGNATGIHPENCYKVDVGKEGYELACHNLDTPMQQLALLAGLATLHDLARGEINKKERR